MAIAGIVDAQAPVSQTVLLVFFALSVAGAVALFARKKGFFKPISFSTTPVIQTFDVVKGFALFIFAEIVLVPLCASLFIYLTTGERNLLGHLTDTGKLWLNNGAIFAGFLAALSVFLGLGSERRRQLFQQTSVPWFKNLALGISLWFFAFPFILAFNEILSSIVESLFPGHYVEQLVVQHLRNSSDHPLLLGISVFQIATIVPFTEEFLFRGLLQSWLKGVFKSSVLGIGIAAFVFSLFHFSVGQGAANIELLASLFLLGCLLGFIYEKQRSLWASIGLHGFFNLMSAILIFND